MPSTTHAVEALVDPRSGDLTHVLWCGEAGVVVDPRPDTLDAVVALLARLGVRPVAVLETAAQGVAQELATRMGWFWSGPVAAWETSGAVVQLQDRLRLELDPAAPEDPASASRQPRMDLDVPPYRVVVQPVASRPGRVTYQVAGHHFTGLERGVIPEGVACPAGTIHHSSTAH